MVGRVEHAVACFQAGFAEHPTPPPPPPTLAKLHPYYCETRPRMSSGDLLSLKALFRDAKVIRC